MCPSERNWNERHLAELALSTRGTYWGAAPVPLWRPSMPFQLLWQMPKTKHWEYFCEFAHAELPFSVLRSSCRPNSTWSSVYPVLFFPVFSVCALFFLWIEFAQMRLAAGCEFVSACNVIGEFLLGADRSMLRKHWKHPRRRTVENLENGIWALQILSVREQIARDCAITIPNLFRSQFGP